MQTELSLRYGEFAVVLRYIVDASFKKGEAETMLMSGGGRQRHASKLSRFVRWLLSSFDGEYYTAQLAREVSRAYDSRLLHTVAHMHLARKILRDTIGINADTLPFLLGPGAYPFYSGAQFKANESLCLHLRLIFEDTVNDTESARREKDILRKCAICVLRGHDRKGAYLTRLYEDTNSARAFIKKIVKGCGLDVATRREGSGDRDYVSSVNLGPSVVARALCLGGPKDSRRVSFVSLVRRLVGTANLSVPDSDAFVEGLEIFRNACLECGVEPDITFPDQFGPILRHTAHPLSAMDRLAETDNGGAIIGLDVPSANEKERYDSNNQRELHEARARADAHILRCAGRNSNAI